MIKNYEEKYEKQVSSLLNDYSMNWAGQALETILAFVDGEIIGIGSLSKNELHPYREYIDIYIQPKKRRKGIGLSIFKKLVTLSKIKKFQVATSSKNTAAISFLKECDFSLVRKSYTPQIKKSTSLLPSDKKINDKSLEELSYSQTEEVFKCQLDNYLEFHQKINPLNDKISFNYWKEIISVDLDRERSKVLVQEGTIEAYILCYESEDKYSIDIGYIGGKDINKLGEYLRFYKQTLNQFFVEFNHFELEADNVDPYAYALLNEFEYDNSESWDTYIFNGK